MKIVSKISVRNRSSKSNQNIEGNRKRKKKEEKLITRTR